MMKKKQEARKRGRAEKDRRKEEFARLLTRAPGPTVKKEAKSLP
ncbi:MAG: hypothetical protein NT166_01870 [Candidatus Aminicenantes bacterium]|nr:hypothetical protein [Candidatus Aminicenantes bacterium]